MNAFWQDIRYGCRTLLKKPAFTITAALTLALGIGANSAIFSIINAMMFRPLPAVRQPGNIVVLANRDKHMEFPHGLSYLDYLDYRAQNDVLEELAIYTPLPISVSGQGHVERTWALFVSGGYFPLFGTEALHGRVLRYDDATPGGGERLVVLGHSYWQRTFGGRPSIVGDAIQVNGQTFMVVGVMPEGFNGNESIFDIDIYLPMTTIDQIREDGDSLFSSRESHIFRAVGRLREGVDVTQAGAAMQMLADRLGEAHPESNANVKLIVALERNARPEPATMGIMQVVGLAFMGLVSLVLFIACANVANLLLARGTSRGREMATRAALGAGRGRIVRQLLTETLLLALAGGLLGIVMAEWATAFVGAIANNLPVDIPINFNFRPDLTVYGFAMTAAAISCVIAGLFPAVQASRVNLTDALKEGRTSSAGAGRHRLRKALVVSQLSVSLLLLICAGLFVRSLINAQRMDMGFERGNLLLMSVDTVSHGYDEDRARQFFDELVGRVGALPGVASASIAGFIPFSGAGLQGANVLVVGGEQVEAADAPTVFYNTVDHRYFRTMGVDIVQGRPFNDMDTSESPDVAIVNETMARQLWSGLDPIGRQFRLNDPEGELCQVVGVARDGKYMILTEEPRPFMYRPLTQDLPPLMANLHVRTDVEPMTMAATVRDVVGSMDATLPVFEVKSLETHLRTGNALLPFRLGAMMVGSFGLLGIVLAAIGIYGVIAYSVGSRTHEFGVRMALGASAGQVRGLVLREGLWLTVIGAAIGLAVAALLTQGLRGLLLNVNPLDAPLYAVVTLALALIASLACYVPARRATRVNPMVALRAE